MTAPGWYPDGQGAQRYWDGQAWTESTMPMASVQPSTPAPTAPRLPNTRPWWRATWALIAAGLVVGIAIGAAAGASSNKTKKVAVPGPTVSTTTTETATETTTELATVTTTPTQVIATHTRTATVTYTPPPPKQYGEGTYVVGTDIKPGEYHSSGSSDCYWARLSSLDTSHIIDNNLSSGPQTVDIRASDKAFEIDGACTFGKV
jgi:hypothetical protein